MKKIEILASTPKIGKAVQDALTKAGITNVTIAPPEQSEKDDVTLLGDDQSTIGTPSYQGIAYFWAHEYRYYLRDATNEQRRQVHAALLAENLQINGKSSRHLDIIESITNP